MQTISFFLFRLQESGLGSQDILSEKPWKLKKKRQHMFFCVNHPFQAIWSRKIFLKILFFFKVHLKREKNSRKFNFFPLPPEYPKDPDPREDFRLNPDPQKKFRSETLILTSPIASYWETTCA